MFKSVFESEFNYLKFVHQIFLKIIMPTQYVTRMTRSLLLVPSEYVRWCRLAALRCISCKCFYKKEKVSDGIVRTSYCNTLSLDKDFFDQGAGV